MDLNQDTLNALLQQKPEDQKEILKSNKSGDILLRNPFWKPDYFGEDGEKVDLINEKNVRNEKQVKKDFSDVSDLKFKNLVQTKEAWREEKAKEEEISLVPGKGKTLNIMEPLRLEHEGKAKEVKEGREFLGDEDCALI